MTRKNRKISRSGTSQRAAIRTYDQVVDCLVHIRTLARLLEAVGTRNDAEPLDAALVSATGSLILREAEQLHTIMKKALPGGLG